MVPFLVKNFFRQVTGEIVQIVLQLYIPIQHPLFSHDTLHFNSYIFIVIPTVFSTLYLVLVNSVPFLSRNFYGQYTILRRHSLSDFTEGPHHIGRRRAIWTRYVYYWELCNFTPNVIPSSLKSGLKTLSP